ncbi:MAG: 30S ribosomal protein S6 [Firmicutes bacterium]|nr:30S ribosomal protein S6 [Bacillota bacterium]
MPLYETTYILNPSLEEEQLTRLQEKYTEYVTKNGGEIINVENWGKRKLAYEVNGNTEGVYIVMKFSSKTQVAEELRRDMRLSDDVVKAMVIRLN